MIGNQGTNVGGIYFDVSLDTKGLIDDSRKADPALDQLSTKLTATASAVGILGAALAALKVAKLADEMRMLSARVDVAAGSAEKGAAAFAELVGVSRRTQTSLQGNIEVFNRLNQSILAMGGTQRDTLAVTELLGKAIKVSGASAIEGKAAMLQFGQALGSGKLQGDELRSLMETAPYLMRRLADGIGVPVGALKKLGEEGKLTADLIMKALNKAADRIDDDFKKLPQTFESAMVVAQDQATLTAMKFDELTGGSSVMAGVVKGLGEVLEQLGKQFEAATTEADKLGKNETVKTWAEGTITVLSYFVDVADLVMRKFRQLGTMMAGTAASFVQLAQGEFKNAANVIRESWNDVWAITDPALAGQKIRQAMEAPAAAAGSIRSRGPKGGSSDDAAGKSKFDSKAYLAGLEKDAAEAYAKVEVIEREGLRKNEVLLKEGKLTRQEFAKANVLVEEAAARARQEINKAELQDLKKEIKTSGKEILAEEQWLATERERQRQYAAAVVQAVDPIAALRQEYDGKLAIVREYEALMAMAGVDATAQAEMAKAAITRQYELQRLALAEQSFRSQSDANAFLINSLNSLSQTATTSIVGLINGTMTASDAMRGLANTVLNEAVSALVQIGVQQLKNYLLGDTLAASNGAAYATSVAAQVSGMSALAAQNAFAATAAIPIVGPGLAPAAAAAAGAAAAALGAPAVTTAPIAGARQYGGPVSAGSMYRVGEGNRPEMFVGASGKSYMIPGERGQVIGNGDLGGGNISVTIVNPEGQPMDGTASGGRDRNGDYAIKVILSAVADDLASGGRTARAVQSRFNLQL